MRIFIFLLAAGVAFSQEALSLHDAVELGLKQHPSLAAAAASTGAAEARVEQAKAGRLPNVHYMESWNRSDNPVFVFSSLLTQHQFGPQNFAIDSLNRPDFLNNFQSQVAVKQMLYDGGVTRARIESAQLGQQLAAQEDRRTQSEVIATIVRTYAGVLLAGERLKLAEQSVRSAEADLVRAESVVKAGMATDMDVLSIRVHLAAMREQRIQASADLSVAQAVLNDAIGLPLDVPHQLTTALGLPRAAVTIQEQTNLEQQAKGSRAEMREAQLATSLADTENKAARNARKPEVAFQTAFEADRQQFVRKGGANWLVGVSLNWSVFNGFADRSRVAETAHLARKAAADEARVDSAIKIQVRRAYADLQAAKERIETALAAVAESEESLRITRNRYQSGLSTVTDLIRNETAVLETGTRYLAAVHDRRVAAAMLEYAAGTLTANSEVLQ